MTLNQAMIDLALSFYDNGIGMQEAVDKAIKIYKVKNDENNR